MGIGPEIPAHLLPQAQASTSAEGTRKEEVGGAGGGEEDSDSDYTPDLPPELLKARREPQASTSSSASTSKVVAGPQLPPHLLASSSSRPSPSRPDSDSEEDFGPGPLPPPAGVSNDDGLNEGARAFLEREERQREKERKEREEAGNKKMKREEWMLVPPKEMDLMSTMDPTKLKSRSFQSGPKAQKSTRSGGMGGADEPNLWTETPQERQQRLQDEALGKKRKAENATPAEEDSEEAMRKRARDRRLKEEVERHNSSNRKESLFESHDKKKKKGGKGDKEKEEPQGWDRDRDMSIGGRLVDDGKRKQMIKDAKGLGGRFGSSGFM
ncbi:GPALPP motifs-containing protein 1 [Sporobolomyces salmoneus]|uniref:GPALPP motifs-containing protein 1 n=1 Tax=Sporobolomyces salmoneus TaxID=183962 RepID=UPI0031811312